MTAKKLLAGLVALAVLGSGCGVRASGVITGGSAPTGPADGVGLYLVANNRLTPVLRATRGQLTPSETLTLLAGGPDADELAQGMTSAIPADIGIVDVVSDPSGAKVMVSADVTTLSAIAVDQIVCTVSGTTAANVRAPGSGSFTVTLVGAGGRSRGPKSCPV
ncbi:hypothetical protein [Amycolatopsis sp.]|jgi:hypothetical protein|uniref:hypothetical protein n=1 Tax=Amycolatopsis sp. TaxID=37632 RepID=UPI002E0CBCE1|nr:hypothetical protein [Amycolatopsis sp.]